MTLNEKRFRGFSESYYQANRRREIFTFPACGERSTALFARRVRGSPTRSAPIGPLTPTLSRKRERGKKARHAG